MAGQANSKLDVDIAKKRLDDLGGKPLIPRPNLSELSKLLLSAFTIGVLAGRYPKLRSRLMQAAFKQMMGPV
jgi:hypothetical protein